MTSKKNKESEDQGFVLSIDIDFVERKFEDEEWPEKKKSQMALDVINNFIKELKDKIRGSLSDRILISEPGNFIIDELESGIKKIECFYSSKIYLLVTKMPEKPRYHPLDGLLLEMDNYNFCANYLDGDEIISQGYDNGEYDSGYFARTIEGWDSDPEAHIVTENTDSSHTFFSFNMAKDIFTNNVEINHQEIAASYCEKADNIVNGNTSGDWGRSKSRSCSILASRIINYLKDNAWAKKVYKKAEDKAENSYDYEGLAKRVREDLGDKEWAKLLEKKAKEL